MQTNTNVESESNARYYAAIMADYAQAKIAYALQDARDAAKQSVVTVRSLVTGRTFSIEGL